MKLIVAITGASGVIYGVRLLEVLTNNKAVETHLIISEFGEQNIRYETTWTVEEVKSLADFCYDVRALGAPISSGSFQTDGMIIAPCSVKTMSALANSYAENLILRAGDVMLKEGRKLVLLVRETPLHLGHLRNMEKLSEMGAVIMPPVPAFYYRPRTIENIIDHTIGKILDVFGIEHDLFPRWSGFPTEDIHA
jgi:4-hydroxy-3-polyprenylbenzoate decarboxylase